MNQNQIDNQPWRPDQNVSTRVKEIATLIADKSGVNLDLEYSMRKAESVANSFIDGMVK